MKPSPEIGYLYINGLNDGHGTPNDRLAEWWWQRKGLTLEHAHVNWLDGGGSDEKLAAVENKIQDMLRNFGGVAIIGSSAGGSLALNAFHDLRDRNVVGIIAHGRLKKGAYSNENRNSLFRRAHFNTPSPAYSFADSLKKAEEEVIPALTIEEKDRLLVLTQLIDMVVPIKLMGIDGVREHKSLTFGHTGGFVAHLLADRNLIVDFAESRLAA